MLPATRLASTLTSSVPPEQGSYRGQGMTRIVAGVFDDEQAATAVARELRDAGFEAADLDQFAVNPPGRNQGLPLGGDEIAGREGGGRRRRRA